MNFFSRETLFLMCAHLVALVVLLFVHPGEAVPVAIAAGILLIASGISFVVDRIRGASVLSAAWRIARAAFWALMVTSVLLTVTQIASPHRVIDTLTVLLPQGWATEERRAQVLSALHILPLIVVLVAPAFYIRAWLREYVLGQLYALDEAARFDSLYSRFDQVASGAAGSDREDQQEERRKAYERMLVRLMFASTKVASFALSNPITDAIAHLRQRQERTMTAWISFPVALEEHHEVTHDPVSEYRKLSHFVIGHAHCTSLDLKVGDHDVFIGRRLRKYNPGLNKALIEGLGQTHPEIRELQAQYDKHVRLGHQVAASRTVDQLFQELRKRLCELPPGSALRKTLEENSSLTGLVFSNERVVTVPDISEFPYFDPSIRGELEARLQFRSAMACPIVVDGRKVGVLLVTSTSERTFHERNHQAFQVAANSIGRLLSLGVAFGLEERGSMYGFGTRNGRGAPDEGLPA